MRGEELASIAREYLVGGVNSPIRARVPPYPLVVSRGRGSRLYDVDGKEYIDFILGYGPLILGHSHPRVRERVVEALEGGWLFGHTTRYEIDLARKILSYVMPGGKIRFVNSGSEATLTAIRLARAVTNRKIIIKFDGCYHGAHDYVLVKAGSAAAETGIPVSPGVPPEVASLTRVLPYNSISNIERVFNKVGDEIAAVIVEPILGNYGVIPGDPEFLRALRKLTKEYGSMLIFDEVITGFRVALGGAQEYYGVSADIVTLGKIIGGGFPIGAVVASKNIMSNLTPEGRVFNAGTFNGHPISMVAGLATLEELERGSLERAHSISNYLCKSLAEECGQSSVECSVNCAPGMGQFFLYSSNVRRPGDVNELSKEVYYRLHKKLLRSGVLIPPSQMEALFVSSEHSVEDIDYMVSLLGHALR